MDITCPNCFHTHTPPDIVINTLRTFERYLTPEAKLLYNRELRTTIKDGRLHIDVCPECDEPLESGIESVKLLDDKIDPKEKRRLTKEWNTKRTLKDKKERNFDVSAIGQIPNDRHNTEVVPENKAEFVETRAQVHGHARADDTIKVRAVHFAPIFERIERGMIEMDDTDTHLPETYVKAAADAFNRVVAAGLVKYGILAKAHSVPLAMAHDLRYRQAFVLTCFSQRTFEEINMFLGGRYFVSDGELGTNDWRPLLEAVGEKPLYAHSVDEVERIMETNAEEVGRGVPSEPTVGRDMQKNSY